MSHQQRIQGAPERGPLRKVAYSMARKRLGRVPEPFAVAAHHTKMFGAMSAFEMALMGPSSDAFMRWSISVF